VNHVGSSSSEELPIKIHIGFIWGTFMKHNTNGNGNYFRVWLEEYKARLEQVSLQARLNNADHSEASSGASAHAPTTNEAPAHPALAGDLSVFFLRPAHLGRH
jgi:hypothetical protein